jgi:hypothetical protein
VVRRSKGEQSTKPGDWLVGRRTRSLGLLAVLLVFAVTRPSAAQIAAPSFSDSGRYLPSEDAIFSTGSESGETPRQARASLLTDSVSSTPPNPRAALAQAAVDAQAPVASLSTLSPRIRPGDRLSVRVRSGEEIVGTFSRASASSLTMVVDGQSREIPADAVQQVVLQRGRNRLMLGLLIGAPVGAYAGSSNCYRVDTSSYRPGTGPPPSCGASVLAGVAIGAAVGALVGSRVWRPTLVYYSTPPHAPAAQGVAAVEAPASVDTRAPVASLSALSSRVLPFEKIYVRTANGKEIVGNFSRASEAALTVDVDGHPREILAGEVQQVWRRGANRVRKGMLFGFLTGAAVTNIIFVGGFGPEAILPATVVGGGTGLMWGALIGAFVHERPLVYRAASPTVRVMPVLAPDRVGLMASVHF